MTIDLVTGMGPGPHIDSRDVGELNAGIIGTGDYVLDIADRLSCTMQSANKAVIGTGGAVMHGRHVTVTAPETVTVQSGTQGQKRNDLIVLRYTRDPATSIESASITCLKGTPTTGTPADPTILTGDILDGARSHDMVLYRIPLDGIVVGAPVPLYKSLNTMDKIRDAVTRAPVILGKQRENGMTSAAGAFGVNYTSPDGTAPDVLVVSNGPYVNGYEDYGKDYQLMRWGDANPDGFQVRVARGGQWASSVPVFFSWMAVWLHPGVKS